MNNIDFKALLFTFQGRINRAPYWTAIVIYVVTMLIVATLAFLLALGSAFFIVLLIVYIPLVVSGVMVGIKRLHDRDRSGWWLAVFYLLPFALNVVSYGLGDLGFIVSLAGFAVSIWGLVELGFLRGTAGPNRYGPDPLAS
jgi:uncharacterized membrane protein YhaH (DUF805 family)